MVRGMPPDSPLHNQNRQKQRKDSKNKQEEIYSAYRIIEKYLKELLLSILTDFDYRGLPFPGL